MNGPQLELGACERVTLGLRRLLDPGGGMEQEALAAHARGCPDCGTLLVVAREVSSGVAAARAAVDAVEPRSYVRDFTRLLQRAIDEHRRVLADLFYQIGKAYLYETSAERLKIVTLKPPGDPGSLREHAGRTLDGAARLAPTIPLWTVERELLRNPDLSDAKAKLHAAGRFLEAALRLQPAHEPATAWLAAQREASDREQEARELFERLASAATHPESRAQALLHLGRHRCREQELAIALSLAVAARMLGTRHPTSLTNLALYALYVGEERLFRASIETLEGEIPCHQTRRRLLELTVLSRQPRATAARRERNSWLRTLALQFPDMTSDGSANPACPGEQA